VERSGKAQRIIGDPGMGRRRRSGKEGGGGRGESAGVA
jgi:hypothetical protein